ncbi:MAG: phosphohistidine phosphatase SixA [Nitrosopumilus sp.]|uniref:phosphohistidine phosphatase SixA n=1 Tax=Nitrosopumilus sp. TaxID=2024843 RepID=UPI00292CE414|nr:phosphohistidine phosphatase SixA [Nitrosopumilus sp.]
MELYLLRHGKAEERLYNIRSDSKRKLTEAGKKEMEFVAKGIRNLDIDFDFIISSPLVRAKQTAEITLEYVNNKKPLTIWNELKPEMDVEKTIKKLTAINPSSSVLLIGHEPHLTTLISNVISSNSPSVNISLKKGGLVHIKTSQEKSKILGSLRSILTPKQLKKLCK